MPYTLGAGGRRDAGAGVSRSARRCKACGAATIRVPRVDATPVGRVRRPECYTCGADTRTIELDVSTVAELMKGDDFGLLADIWRAVALTAEVKS
jgi:hypothetical protein